MKKLKVNRKKNRKKQISDIKLKKVYIYEINLHKRKFKTWGVQKRFCNARIFRNPLEKHGTAFKMSMAIKKVTMGKGLKIHVFNYFFKLIKRSRN